MELRNALNELIFKRQQLLNKHSKKYINENTITNDNFYHDNIVKIDDKIVKLANEVLKKLKINRKLVAVEQVYCDKDIAKFLEDQMEQIR